MPFASNGWMSLNFFLEESNAHCKQASKQIGSALENFLERKQHHAMPFASNRCP
jgi:hypothetical protein